MGDQMKLIAVTVFALVSMFLARDVGRTIADAQRNAGGRRVNVGCW